MKSSDLPVWNDSTSLGPHVDNNSGSLAVRDACERKHEHDEQGWLRLSSSTHELLQDHMSREEEEEQEQEEGQDNVNEEEDGAAALENSLETVFKRY
jgi:hypothetical protein